MHFQYDTGRTYNGPQILHIRSANLTPGACTNACDLDNDQAWEDMDVEFWDTSRNIKGTVQVQRFFVARAQSDPTVYNEILGDIVQLAYFKGCYTTR